MRGSMQIQCFRDRAGRDLLAALSAGHPVGLLYVTNSFSGHTFLLDTGIGGGGIVFF